MRKYLLLVIAAALSLTILLAPSALAASSGSTDSGDIVVQTVPGPTAAEKVTQRAKSSWPWYVTRGSGIVAALALIILMLSGIGQVTGYTFRFLEPLTAWASHKALGLTFGIAVLIHMLSLLFDRFVSFSILQIFVPWLSSYHPVTIAGFHLGSFYLALGVLAFYAVALITITSFLWVDKKPYTWKLFHLLSYIVILLVFVHALYLGTDLAHGWMRWLWILLGVGIAAATVHRLWRAKTT
jgi:predicted ferric reductase